MKLLGNRYELSNTNIFLSYNFFFQRYFVNENFVDALRNVAFLMIGGEGEASKKFMQQGAWINYAKKHNAICFQLEHRYYGKSQPTL